MSAGEPSPGRQLFDGAHPLWSFLTAFSGLSDEQQKVRLTATGLPSLVPCRISGAAMLDESGRAWTAVVQKDGHPLSEQDVEAIVGDGGELFLRAVGHGAPTLVADGERSGSLQIPAALSRLGVGHLVLAPLATLRSRLGVLFLGRDGTRPFSDEETMILRTVADQSAIGIENLRLYRQLEEAYEKIQQRHELILEAAGEGVYGLDREGKTTFVNPAAAEMLQYRAEELLGESMHAILHHTRRGGSPYQAKDCPIYASFRDGKVHTVDDEVFWRKDGSSIPVEYTSTPIRRGEELIGAVVIFRNLSDLKRSQEELRVALTEVRELKDRLEDENVYLQEEISLKHGFSEIVGASPSIRKVLEAVETVAPTGANVVITGETGTGKELIARAVHDLSPRKDRTLIKVNCASIPRDLFESEFFGHVRGAFTGAVKDRSGRFELADKGTLFLDEVGEIPLEMQSKLLRVLQEGSFERIGDERTRKVDVRILAATNRNLKHEVEEGRFRQDLYYRLDVFPIAVPPLRDRGEDIALLAGYFLDRIATEMGREKPHLTRANVEDLKRYDWPGNVRELRNVLERAVITSRDGRLSFDLPSTSSSPAPGRILDTSAQTTPPTSVVSEAEMRQREKDNILAALAEADGRIYGQGGAAELLGVKPTTLASRIKKLGLQ